MTAKKLSKAEQAIIDEYGFKNEAEKAADAENKEDVNYTPSMSIKKDRFTVVIDGKTLKLDDVELSLVAVNYKYMRRGGADINFGVVEESVEVPHGSYDPFLDTLGTEMCGAVPVYDLPSDVTPAQRKANNDKGTFYAVVYGKMDDGTLVRLTLPSGKAGAVQRTIKNSGVSFIGFLKLKFAIDDDTGNLKVTMVDAAQDIVAAKKTLEEDVLPAVERSNSYVLTQHSKNSGENKVAGEILKDSESPF